jgi:copper chaperone CopZ
MEQLVIPLPGVWADHHVLVVRDLLTAIDGVTGVDVSARDHRASVTVDDGTTDLETLTRALSDAGYPPGDADQTEAPPTDKPAWARGGSRTTTTDPADLTMSGDHRKY